MPPASHYETLFVARQPVLDASLNTWGYFHYYRRCLEHTYSEFTDPLQATLSVIQCLPACGGPSTHPHKALIHLPPQALMTGIPKAMGAHCVVPVLDPYPLDDPSICKPCAPCATRATSWPWTCPSPMT